MRERIHEDEEEEWGERRRRCSLTCGIDVLYNKICIGSYVRIDKVVCIALGIRILGDIVAQIGTQVIGILDICREIDGLEQMIFKELELQL